MEKTISSNWKLGLFVILGILIFILAIYFVGKNKNMFGDTFTIQTKFKTVTGLKVGNNVRLSGINIGTVSNVEILSDTSVLVQLIVKKDKQKFIFNNAFASIGSDGLMGDKIITIAATESNVPKQMLKDGDSIASKNPIEMIDIMNTVKGSVDNANIITEQLALFSYKMNNNDGVLSKLLADKDFSNSIQNSLANLENSTNEFSKFTYKMNNGKGTFAKLMNDDKLGKKLDSTMSNLQASSKGLDENIQAARSSILLRGGFKKMKKAADKKIADSLKTEKKRIQMK